MRWKLWLTAFTISMVTACSGPAIQGYSTLRSVDGELGSRDLLPEPRPQEAITGDDYYAIKLEQVFVGDELGEAPGEVAIITQIEGALPEGVRCDELDLAGLDVDLSSRERSNVQQSQRCAFKHLVAIETVQARSAIPFESAIITPPFKMGVRPIGLRFLIVELEDVELARKIVRWGEQLYGELGEQVLGESKQWTKEMVNIGFSTVNWLLDYAAKPKRVFEYETDFVPVETVSGVDTPQNLFMGGDYILVGFVQEGDEQVELGALRLAEDLVFDSGRLYWKEDKRPYVDSTYIVYKVIRHSRFPGALPIALPKLARTLSRGEVQAKQLFAEAAESVRDLQDEAVLNETEGRYLLDLFDWWEDSEALLVEGQAALAGGEIAPRDWQAVFEPLEPALSLRLGRIALLGRYKAHLRQLDERLYTHFGVHPGIWQSECVSLRHRVDELADIYRSLHAGVVAASEEIELMWYDHKVKGKAVGLSTDQLDELRMWLAGVFGPSIDEMGHPVYEILPLELTEPSCPGLRR